MIRMGPYDVFEKWDMVSRSWAGEAVDAGEDRHGRKLLPIWQLEADRGGEQACRDYIRFKCDALNADPADEGPKAAADSELTTLLHQIGYAEIRARVLNLVEAIKSSGADAAFDELPPRLSERIREAFALGAQRALRWTDDIGEIPDIEALRARRRPPFPTAIRGKRNVLAMFCVRFYGMLDVVYIHDIWPDRVTLVDLDLDCLEVTRQIYPPEWQYIHADYKEFLRQAEQQGLVYDLIVADPWRSQCPEVGFDMLPTIMDRCSDLFVMHYVDEMFEELGVTKADFPALSHAIKQRTGVDVAVIEWVERSRENGWLVMRKAA